MGKIKIHCKFLDIDNNSTQININSKPTPIEETVDDSISVQKFLNLFPVKNITMLLRINTNKSIPIEPIDGSKNLLSILDKSGQENYGRDENHPVLLKINNIYYKNVNESDVSTIETPKNNNSNYLNLINRKEKKSFKALTSTGERIPIVNLEYCIENNFYGLSQTNPIIVESIIAMYFMLPAIDMINRKKIIPDKNIKIQNLLNTVLNTPITDPYKKSNIPYNPERVYFQFNGQEYSAKSNMSNTFANQFPDLVENDNKNNPIKIFQKFGIKYCIPQKENKNFMTIIPDYMTISDFLKKLEQKIIIDQRTIILECNNKKIECYDNNKSLNLIENLNTDGKVKPFINIYHKSMNIYYKVPVKSSVDLVSINYNDTISMFTNKIQKSLLAPVNISIKYNGKEINSGKDGNTPFFDAFKFPNDVSKENPIIIKYPNINLNVNCQLGKEPFKKKVSVSYENNILDLLNMLDLDPKDFRFKNIKLGFGSCSINDTTRSIYDIMGRVRVEKALKDDNYLINITCEEAKIDVYIPSIGRKVKCQVSEDSKVEDIINQISQESFYNKSNLIIKFNGNQIEANSNTCKELIYSTNLGLENYKNGDQIIIDDAPVEIYYKVPKKSDTIKKLSIQPLSKMSEFINMVKKDLDQVSVVKLKYGNLESNSSIKDTNRTVSEVLKGKFGENNIWEIVQESGEQEVIFKNTMDEKEFKMLLPKSCTIESLRDKLAEENLGDISSDNVSLMFGGKALDNQKTIGELKIPPKGIISIFVDSEEGPDFLESIDGLDL